QTFDAPRTLLYMTRQETSETLDDITLLLQVPADKVFETVESTVLWPGPVTLTVYGTEDERLAMLAELKGASRSFTLHYVYKPEKPSSYPMDYMRKIGVDSAKTNNVFLVDKLDELEYTKGVHSSALVRTTLNAQNK
ncbi:hypothetical protein PFISCL1PPCAC_13169, partial [Pristionchus fissidentatus]